MEISVASQYGGLGHFKKEGGSRDNFEHGLSNVFFFLPV
jgi:hypothetical protein